MKKLAFLTLTFLMAIGILQIQAQDPKKEKLAINETKKEIKTEKKELKSERQILRKLEGNDVSTISKNSFYADFGDIPNAKWTRAAYFDEVRFNKDGHDMTGFYDYDGKLVGTTTIKTFADVPLRGQKEIKSKYKDYTVGPVIYYDDNEFNETDMMLYGLQFDDEDNYFVELTKGSSKIIVRVNSAGDLYFFKQL